MKKRYRSYTAKKYKLPKRILFFAVCAIIIFLFALIVGNNLKKQMENAPIDREPVETQDFEENQTSNGIENGNSTHPENKATVKAGYLNLSEIVDQKDIQQRIDQLVLDGFNALSFVAIENDKLTYASAALEEYSRLPASSEIVSLQDLTDAIAYANEKNITTSAFYCKGSDDVLDVMICSELSQIGFDEIIISGFEDLLTENGGEITPCISYIKNIRTVAASSHISLCLAPSAYTYARNSYQIEKLFTYTEFLSINVTSLDSEKVSELCDNISGSFSTYMLRPVTNGDAVEIPAVLSEKGISTIQYISPIPEADPETSDTTTEEQ
ncbi:MAG: hypothetical protein IKL36_06820 [Clostridia bacterium]|nr:hypothetical protein [Clostridia bacterium]